MIEKLAEIEQKFERLTAELSDPEVLNNNDRLKRVSKERASLERMVETFREYRDISKQLDETMAMLEDKDPDVRTMAREEFPGLREQKTVLEEKLKLLLLPKDPNDDKDI